jgi:hypothetical protein
LNTSASNSSSTLFNLSFFARPRSRFDTVPYR